MLKFKELKLRKYSRFFLRIFGGFSVLMVALFLAVFFLIRSHDFQTWLGKKVSEKLSKDSGIQFHIGKIKIDLLKSAELDEVFVGGKNQDTLISLNSIQCKVDEFNRKTHHVRLRDVVLEQPKFILHEPEKGSNLLDSLIRFFSSPADTSSGGSSEWSFDPGKVELKNGYVRISRDTKDTLKNDGMFNSDWLTFSEIYGTIDKLHFDHAPIRLKAEHLKTKTNFGIEVKNLSTFFLFGKNKMEFTNTHLTTEHSNIKTNIFFHYDSVECLSDFINSVRITASFHKGTVFHPADLKGFIPDFACAEDTLRISCEFDGTIADFHTQNLHIQLKNKNLFIGDLSAVGLPDINQTFVHASIKKLYVDWNSLQGLKIPPFCKKNRLEIPQELVRSGYMDFKGELNGNAEDVVVFGKAKTGVGNLKMDLEWKKNLPYEWEYNGTVQTDHLQIGKVLNNKEYNYTSFSLNVKGKGITIDKISVEAQGKFNYLDFHGYRYHNINTNGTLKNREFKGKLEVRDTSFNLSFDGTALFEKKDYHFDFIAEIKKFHPENLNFFSMKEKGYFSTQMLIMLKGTDINSMSGTIHFDDTKFITANKIHKLNTFYLELEQQQIPQKITLNSDFLNTSIEGDFRLTHLHESVVEVLNHYYPTFFKIKTENPENYRHEYIKMNLKIKKFNFVHDLFYDKLDVANNTRLFLSANRNEHNIKINFYSDSIKYGFLNLKKIALDVNEDDIINLKLRLHELFVSDSLDMKNLELCINSRDKLSTFDLDWRGDTTDFKNHGEIEGKVLFNNESFYLFIDTAYVQVHDSIWALKQSGIIAWSKNKSLLISPIKIYHNRQRFMLEGYMTPERSEEKVNLEMHEINLMSFHPILSSLGLETTGFMEGCVSFYHHGDIFMANGDLNIKDFHLNGNSFGELNLTTVYHQESKSLSVHGYTDLHLPEFTGITNKNIQFFGEIFPFDKENNFDLNFKFMPLNPVLINPLVKDIFTIKKGYVMGNLKLTGKFNDPQLNGELMLKNTVLIPDITKVAYILNGQIEVMPDQIRFSDVTMNDQTDKKRKFSGVINGNIFHKKFDKWQLDFDITHRNMLVMNTTEKDNSLYYGKIFSSGNIGLWGFLDDLYMSVEDTIKPNSRFYLALDNPEEASEFEFIHFKKKDTLKAGRKIKDLSRFHLNMHITARPDFSTQIIFDRTVGDVLNANGYASINMRINTRGKFEMDGQYQIESGDYTFSLEKLIQKKFELEQGSSILWSGDPINADIDITAYYKNRVSIAPLINDTTGQFKSRTPVYCKLRMTKKLLNPDIAFEFDFPSINENVKSSIYNILLDENERNRQVFSFLMLRSFIPPLIYTNHSGGVTAGNAAANTGSEFLSAKMNSLFHSAMGNMLGDLDIGFNYNPGSQSNSDEIMMNMNKNFFNNRLTFEGNFGVNNNRNTTGSSNFIGDVNIEYKLSQDGKYKVRGFNRTNDVTQLTVTGGLYTQGVGIGLNESFETWNELFRKYLKKIKKKNEG